jgi:hypothetical protein
VIRDIFRGIARRIFAMSGLKSKLVLLVLTAMGFFWASCNDTPTVPIPPPEMCDIPTPPDIDGYVVVHCDSSSAVQGDVALVFNDDVGQGVMERLDVDGVGSFDVVVEADIGDLILVEIKREDRLSGQIEATVPAE